MIKRERESIYYRILKFLAWVIVIGDIVYQDDAEGIGLKER